jgi:hypothetical protein
MPDFLEMLSDSQATVVALLGDTARLDWGDVPTWVGALGTVLALSFAVLTLRSELSSRRRAHEEARRAQANLVTAWVDHVDAARLDDLRDGPAPRGGQQSAVIVSNQSDRVVHEVFWVLWDEETEARMDRGYIRALGPRTERVILVRGPSGGDPIVLLHFTDAQGILWGRTRKLLTFEEWFEDPIQTASIDQGNDWQLRWPPEEVEAVKAYLEQRPD